MKKIVLLGALALVSLGGIFYISLGPQANLLPATLGDVQAAASKPSEAPQNPELSHRSGTIAQGVSELLENGNPPAADIERALRGVLDADPLVRLDGVRTLWLAQSKKVLPLLIALLESDKDSRVRAEAAAGLESFDAVGAASLALVAALRDTDPGVRENALLSLRMHRNDRVQSALLSQLKSGGWDELTREAVGAFLNRYYPHLDPFQDPLKPASGS